MESYVIGMAIALIKVAIKSPTHAAELKSLLLELRDAISAAYPGA